MILTRSQLDALVALLSESLRGRAGDALTPDVIEERARNAAQLLTATYDMWPLVEPVPVPHVWSESQGIGQRRYCLNCDVREYYSARVGLDGGCKGKPPGSAS